MEIIVGGLLDKNLAALNDVVSSSIQLSVCHNCDSIRFELESSIRERMNMFNFFHSRMVL